MYIKIFVIKIFFFFKELVFILQTPALFCE